MFLHKGYVLLLRQCSCITFWLSVLYQIAYKTLKIWVSVILSFQLSPSSLQIMTGMYETHLLYDYMCTTPVFLGPGNMSRKGEQWKEDSFAHGFWKWTCWVSFTLLVFYDDQIVEMFWSQIN